MCSCLAAKWSQRSGRVSESTCTSRQKTRWGRGGGYLMITEEQFSIKTCFGYSLESPLRSDSNEYPRFYGEISKIMPYHQIPTLSVPLSRSAECMSKLWWHLQDRSDKPSLVTLMRLWYLSHRRPAKAQVSLCMHAVSPEPLLFALSMEVDKGSEKKSEI